MRDKGGWGEGEHEKRKTARMTKAKGSEFGAQRMIFFLSTKRNGKGGWGGGWRSLAWSWL